MRSFRCPSTDQFTMQFTPRDLEQIERFIRGTVANPEELRELPHWNSQTRMFLDNITREIRRDRAEMERRVADVRANEATPQATVEFGRVPRFVAPRTRAPRVRRDR